MKIVTFFLCIEKRDENGKCCDERGSILDSSFPFKAFYLKIALAIFLKWLFYLLTSIYCNTYCLSNEFCHNKLKQRNHLSRFYRFITGKSYPQTIDCIFGMGTKVGILQD